ncbi:putative ribonuclease ZC3H12C [Orchesella cincta]|uniref:Putative ribonuclease ZC3H12C n=1 Tax=Orchesella cincta TaxID=48709 RepID=A0A1D2MM86_ORCCI|nr:putative ribonuclease ZC3H12C [Orchesella cincta]
MSNKRQLPSGSITSLIDNTIIMDLATSNNQETSTSSASHQDKQNSKLVGNMHYHHHHQNPFSHMLSSPTSECGPGAPEIGVGIGKLTASTSFSGSSTRSVGLYGSKQPLQDSEDSSYDSDCEVSDATTSHNDVSRTVSDTLGQEFEEYVTISSKGQQTAGLTNPGASTVESMGRFQFNTEDACYKSRLEFAKKLGYTEMQVQIVLSKLGPNPSQNELLNELILLDDNSSLNEIISTPEPTEGLSTGTAGAATSTTSSQSSSNLRHIVIDGSNIAMSHGNNKVFSCRGIKLAVDYFKTRGHKQITVFVPSYRKESPKPDDPVSDQHILTELEKESILVYTPSRLLNNNRRLICYDDRYILKLAVEEDGIVVSNDNYRDLTIESLDFKRVVEEKLLMYSFVNDRFMPPEDPLGRNGPTLDQFLSKSVVTQLPPPCPYGRKCTYGQKCKYYHSTQARSVSETLRKQAAMKTQSVPIVLSSNQTPVSRTRSAIVPMESSKDLSMSTMGATNTHRKLQRQLSVNPCGDPRIRQTFQRGASLNSGSHSLFPQQDSYSLSPFPGNPALSEVWKPAPSDWTTPGGGSSGGGGGGGLNQNHQDDWVKSQMTRHLSLPTPSKPPKQQQQHPPPQHLAPVSGNPSRTTMYYHLAAIFPEHQVEHVMSLYPDCNDPSFICRQIVSIFK